MTYNFPKVLLHFIRVSVSIGETQPHIPTLIICIQEPRFVKFTSSWFSKVCWHCLHSLNTGLFLSLAIMVMWGHFFCCQGFSNINFNDLLEVNKPHFSRFKVCTYAWHSPPLGGLLPAGRFLENRATCGLFRSSLLGVLCSLDSFLLWTVPTAPQAGSDKWIRTERERKAERQKQEEIPDEPKAADCCSRLVGIYTLVLNPSRQGKDSLLSTPSLSG